ncbi:RidA family protein [Candidatus Binatus sp.]|uniref:RidA family protein n=1 Tax=Candidatus Binatus sp. TaxID=2811406 RepID=UPI003C710F63
MQVRPINAQTWLGAFNINQAIEVTAGQRVLYVSGQTSNDANGAPMHPGDLAAQFKLAWKNLVEVLAAADMKPGNIVRLNLYTTDVEGFMAKANELVPMFANAGCKPVSTLLGVTRLFEPSIMIEIEATAVA